MVSGGLEFLDRAARSSGGHRRPAAQRHRRRRTRVAAGRTCRDPSVRTRYAGATGYSAAMRSRHARARAPRRTVHPCRFRPSRLSSWQTGKDMPTNKPFAIGSRLELFLDEELIQHLQGARRHLHEPRPAGVAIRADRPWDGIHNWGFQIIPDGDVFRMYYRAWPEGSGTPDLIAPGLRGEPRRQELDETGPAADPHTRQLRQQPVRGLADS